MSLELHVIPMGQQVRDRAEREAFVGEIHRLTGLPMRRCASCGHWSGLAGVDGGLCLSCSDPTPCPDCEEPWPDRLSACPSCGLTIAEIGERLASENPRYGSGNPDWERDFERTGEP